jgi:hypothetical protein
VDRGASPASRRRRRHRTPAAVAGSKAHGDARRGLQIGRGVGPCGLPPHTTVHTGRIRRFGRLCERLVPQRGGRRGLVHRRRSFDPWIAAPLAFRLARRPEKYRFCRIAPSRARNLLSASTVQVFGGLLRLLCPLLLLRRDRGPYDPFSPDSRTRRRSPEARPAAFAARPPDLPSHDARQRDGNCRRSFTITSSALAHVAPTATIRAAKRRPFIQHVSMV